MTTIIKGDFSRRPSHPSAARADEKPAPAYLLKITLAFSDPPIWRRIRVPGETTLSKLHQIIQRCMGWNDIHDHRFLVGKVFYAPSEDGEIWEKTGERDETAFHLAMLENDMKWCFTYIYDFGDGWEHQIELEQIIPTQQDLHSVILIDGERACPPENVGGIPGYEEFLLIINDPRHEHHRKVAGWFGANHFNAEDFDISAINQALKTDQISSPLN